jgi:hypothetical protein
LLFVEGFGGVRRINREGILSTLVGGENTTGKSEGPDAATELYAAAAQSVAVHGGYAYVGMGNRVMRVSLATDAFAQVTKTDHAAEERGSCGFYGPFETGDGGLASEAEVCEPRDLSFDNEGNLYLSVWEAVRKVSTAGIITTIAGHPTGGFGGYAGNGGQATEATLSDNVGEVVVDPTNGSLYIADDGNEAVREVAPDGVITTVLGREEP